MVLFVRNDCASLLPKLLFIVVSLLLFFIAEPSGVINPFLTKDRIRNLASNLLKFFNLATPLGAFFFTQLVFTCSDNVVSNFFLSLTGIF